MGDSRTPKFTPTVDQQRALEAAIGPNGIQGKNVFITGPAGTGKTSVSDHIMRGLVSKFRNPVAVRRLAPTHGATQNLKCPETGGLSTVQSFFRTYPVNCLRDFKPLGESATPDMRLRREKEIRNAHWESVRERAKARFGPDFFTRGLNEVRAFQIDEVSMFSGRALEAIEYICRATSGRMDVLFGGKQVILTGDRAQLPTVQTRDQAYDMFYPLARGEAPKRFDQAVFMLDDPSSPGGKKKVTFYEAFDLYPLWVNFRVTPEDLYMRYLLQNVRYGLLDNFSRLIVEEMMVPLEWRNINLPHGFRPPVIHSTNAKVAEENDAQLAALTTPLHTIKTRDFIPTDNEGLKKVIEGFLDERTSGGETRTKPGKRDKEWVFRCKVGQTVVLTDNINPDDGLYNGASGIVRKITFGTNVFADEKPIAGKAAVYVDFTTRPGQPPYAVEAITIDYKHSENLIAFRTFVPLKGGASGTAHAWQGRSLELGLVDLGSCFADGQLYTMLSRARDWTKLRILNFDMRSLRADPEFVRHELDNMPPEAKRAMEELKEKVLALGPPRIQRKIGFENYRSEGRIVDTRKGVREAAAQPDAAIVEAEEDVQPEVAELAKTGKTLLFLCDGDYPNYERAISALDATVDKLISSSGYPIFEIVTSCTTPKFTGLLTGHCKQKGYHFSVVPLGMITHGADSPEKAYAEFAAEFIDIVFVVTTRERCRDQLYQDVCRKLSPMGKTVQITTSLLQN